MGVDGKKYKTKGCAASQLNLLKIYFDLLKKIIGEADDSKTFTELYFESTDVQTLVENILKLNTISIDTVSIDMVVALVHHVENDLGEINPGILESINQLELPPTKDGRN